MQERIVSIRRVGKKKLVDIEVDGDRLFFANGVLTHNSGFSTTDPKMNRTSDSMGVPFTADFMGFLWQNDGDREAELINLTILKNRLGGHIGKRLQFSINYRNLILEDIKEMQSSEDSKAMVDEILSEVDA